MLTLLANFNQKLSSGDSREGRVQPPCKPSPQLPVSLGARHLRIIWAQLAAIDCRPQHPSQMNTFFSVAVMVQARQRVQVGEMMRA